MQTALLVFLGGGFGSVMRWLTGLAAVRLLGAGFPYGTLAVNLIGGFAMGVFARLIPTLALGNSHWRFLLMTGMLGGFTTFSAFSLDSASLWIEGETTTALLYVLLSVAGSLAMVALGLGVGSALVR